MAADHDLDVAVRRAAPRAPRDFAAAVEARIGKRERARGQRLAAAGALVTLAAAAVVILLLRPAPHPLPSRDEWHATVARAATVRAPDGTVLPLAGGQALASGDGVAVSATGEARLERPGAAITLAGDSAVRLQDHEWQIEYGSARLEGPGSRVAVDGTTIAALGSDAAVTVQARRNDMNAKTVLSPSKKALAGAAAAAVIAVAVSQGKALLQPAASPAVELAGDDRALVLPDGKPMITRRAAPAPQIAPGQSFASLQAAVAAKQDELRGCYTKTNDSPPGLVTLSVEARLSKRGSDAVVDEVRVHTPYEHRLAGTELCITSVLRGVQFPFPPDTVNPAIVTFPLFIDTPDDSMKLLEPHF